MRYLTAALGAAALFAPMLVAWTAPAHAIQMNEAVLQGLDKITARISTIKVGVGETVNFGSLQITLRACDKHPPEETPESAAFLQVVEQKPGEQPVTRFSGWMFASSPALSAMEHPVYDLWVLDCDNKNGAPPEQPPAEGQPAQQDGAAPAN
ncbi:MAG TPA: DUF2155 domain-containing protein [Dongiaceae bacterium]|jgi:hypothetical protein|nr:DUF2155 domain-containing protein [Dongiaceae bacterium]